MLSCCSYEGLPADDALLPGHDRRYPVMVATNIGSVWFGANGHTDAVDAERVVCGHQGETVCHLFRSSPINSLPNIDSFVTTIIVISFFLLLLSTLHFFLSYHLIFNNEYC